MHACAEVLLSKDEIRIHSSETMGYSSVDYIENNMAGLVERKEKRWNYKTYNTP